MKKYLILRLDAPLMSFGAPIVDNYGRTERFPALSAFAGLLANALGYDHCQYTEIQILQSRLRMAVRCDRPGYELRDFQTVDLGQDFMLNRNTWTTWGRLDVRKGGPDAQKGTHIRYRDYIADAIYTVALCLEPGTEQPDLGTIETALITPARPLFIGRKPCLPATRFLLSNIEAESPLDALREIAPIEKIRRTRCIEEGISAWWSPSDGGEHPGPNREIRVTDQRDWRNQIHSGQRLLLHGLIYPREVIHE